MDKYLGNIRTLGVHVFQLLRCDVLALRQLENVLRTIDDLNRSVWEDHANVARRQPTVLTECLLRLFFILEVAMENGGTLVANFTTRIRVRGHVLHLRYVT